METFWWNRKGQKHPQAAPESARLPMEKKVWWGFAAALALLLIVGLTAYTQGVKLQNNDTIVDHTHQVISSLRKIQSLVADAETGERGYLITGDQLFLRPYNEAINSLDGELSSLRKLVSDNPAQQENRRQLENATVKRIEQLRQAAGKLEEGKYLRLFVSDNGCGMDRATLNRIFDPFFTTKKQGEGTGLGLSVVHGIVTSHGGAIAVTSQPDEGTAFHLYFPVATEAVQSISDAVTESPQARSEHILYVDDEEALVFLATRLLGRRGYRVSGFTSAVTALNQFRENPADFDAVVTDLSMPGMSGFELTEEIHRTRADIPVLLTSGYLQAEDQEEAEKLGMRETLQKPATADKSAGALEKILAPQLAKNASYREVSEIPG